MVSTEVRGFSIPTALQKQVSVNHEALEFCGYFSDSNTLLADIQKGSDTFRAGPLEILEWKWMLSADQAANSVSFSLTAMAPLPMRSRR